jgi:hypothetical protein
MPKSRKTRPSATPGRSKGANCQKSIAKNYYCASRSYKGKERKLYLEGCAQVSKMKGNLPTQEIIRLRETIT